MSRSTWKGPFTDYIQSAQKETKTGVTNKVGGFIDKGGQYAPKKIWSRRSQILPADTGKEYLVHNGRAFISVKCTQFMCSRKWGEFAVTRKKPLHKLNKRKQLHKS